MKSILEFNLPEDNSDFLTCIKAHEYKSICYDIYSYIRNRIKHEELSEETRAALESVRDILLSELDERNLNLFD